MRIAEVRLQLTKGKWGRFHPADIAGCSPCRTALYTTPSQRTLTETDVLTLSAPHYFTFDHNLALFPPLWRMHSHVTVSLYKSGQEGWMRRLLSYSLAVNILGVRPKQTLVNSAGKSHTFFNASCVITGKLSFTKKQTKITLFSCNKR